MPVLLIAAAFLVWWLLSHHASEGSGDSTKSGISAAAASVAGVDQSTFAANYSPLDDLADAWANAEGWNVAGSLAQRNNNPANLKGNWPGVVGHTASGFAIFDSPDSGRDAEKQWLARQVSQHPAWTLRQLFAKVLGDLQGNPVNNAQGDSDQEAENVAHYLGISPGVNLHDYLGGT